jgi:hypothetical protein
MFWLLCWFQLRLVKFLLFCFACIELFDLIDRVFYRTFDGVDFVVKIVLCQMNLSLENFDLIYKLS